MGMYYSLRCKLKLNNKYVPVIESLLNDDGVDWSNLTEIDSIKEYSKDSRSFFIPFGSLSYEPDNWEEESQDWNNTIQDEIWSFQCSVKTSSTIRAFFENVIPIIAERSIHIEYFYEENEYSDLYELKDRTVVATGEKIRYGYTDEEPWRLVQLR